MVRRGFDEVEAATEGSVRKGRRQAKGAPDITIVWSSTDNDPNVGRSYPDPEQLFELARALGRFAACRTLQQSKLRQSSDVFAIETNGEMADASVSA